MIIYGTLEIWDLFCAVQQLLGAKNLSLHLVIFLSSRMFNGVNILYNYSTDCVDVWDSKVLRSAAGAHFRINMYLDVDWELLPVNYVKENDKIVLADSFKQSVKSKRPTTQELFDTLVKVEEEASNLKSVEVLEGGSVLHRDASYSDPNLLKIYKQLPLPYSTYYDLRLSPDASVVLVIGGEAHGLSSAAYKLAHDFDGHKVYYLKPL